MRGILSSRLVNRPSRLSTFARPFGFSRLASNTRRSGSVGSNSLIVVDDTRPLWDSVVEHVEQTQITSRRQDAFEFSIRGNESQVIEITLKPGEAARADAGSLIYMEDQVEMEATTGGGLGDGFKRWVTGESFFIVDFVNKSEEERRIVLGSAHPSKLLPLMLSDHGGSLIASKGSLIVSHQNVKVELYSTSMMTGLVGSEGFLLQHLTGNELVVLRAGGAVVAKDLAPGEVLRVARGNLVAFESSVEFSVEMVKGAKNMLVGGQGFFMGVLNGGDRGGKVILQSMGFERMSEAIGKHVRQSPGLGIPLGGGGGGGGGAGGEGEGGEGEGGEVEGGGEGGGELGEEAAAAPKKSGGGWFSALFEDEEDDE